MSIKEKLSSFIPPPDDEEKGTPGWMVVVLAITMLALVGGLGWYILTPPLA